MSGPHAESVDCWCQPEVKVPCAECDRAPGCWRCGGTGWLSDEDAAEIGADLPKVVIHRSEE